MVTKPYKTIQNRDSRATSRYTVYIPPPQKKTDMAMENPAWMSRCKYQLTNWDFPMSFVSFQARCVACALNIFVWRFSAQNVALGCLNLYCRRFSGWEWPRHWGFRNTASWLVHEYHSISWTKIIIEGGMFIPKNIVHASALSILHVCLQTQQLRQKGDSIHFPTFLEEKTKPDISMRRAPLPDIKNIIDKAGPNFGL